MEKFALTIALVQSLTVSTGIAFAVDALAIVVILGKLLGTELGRVALTKDEVKWVALARPVF